MRCGFPAAAAYASSKAAVRNHTKSVALYCAEQVLNIRCNSIHPRRGRGHRAAAHLGMAASLGAEYSDRTADRVLAGYDFWRQTPFSLGQTGRQSSERSAMTIEVREAINAPLHDTVPQNRYPASNRMLPSRLGPRRAIRCKLQDRASKRTWHL